MNATLETVLKFLTTLLGLVVVILNFVFNRIDKAKTADHRRRIISMTLLFSAMVFQVLGVVLWTYEIRWIPILLFIVSTFFTTVDYMRATWPADRRDILFLVLHYSATTLLITFCLIMPMIQRLIDVQIKVTDKTGTNFVEIADSILALESNQTQILRFESNLVVIVDKLSSNQTAQASKKK